MAPKKAQAKRPPTPPSPASYYTSSSEDEPEYQAKPSQGPNKASGSTLKVPQSAPPQRPELSSEDETAESSDDSDSTTQEKVECQEPASVKKPSQQQQVKELPPSSDSESESESEEDYSLTPLAPNPSAKPTVPKPTGDGAAGSSDKQGDNKRKPSEVASPSKPKKERTEKKLKVSEAASPSPCKEDNNKASKKRFERLWSPQDEMVILEVLVAFKKDHGHEPATSAEINTLYNTVKTSFHADFSRAQLASKLSTLRRRYSKLISKEKGQPSKKKPLDVDVQAALNLAKEIWGERKIEGSNADLGMNGPSENGPKKSKLVLPKAEFIENAAIPSRNPKPPLNQSVSISEGKGGESPIIDLVADAFNSTVWDFLKKNFTLLGPAETKTVEKIWNDLKLREMEYQIHRLEATKEIIKIVRDKMSR